MSDNHQFLRSSGVFKAQWQTWSRQDLVTQRCCPRCWHSSAKMALRIKKLIILLWHLRKTTLPHIHTSSSASSSNNLLQIWQLQLPETHLSPVYKHTSLQRSTTTWMAASHETLSGLSHLSHSASSSSHPEPRSSFPNTTRLKAVISKQHPGDSSIFARLDHPAKGAAEDWASYWCNTPLNNIVPCCYDNTAQYVRECCL